MESTKRAIKFQGIDTKKSILSFWAVILIVDIFFYIINISIGFSATSIEFSTTLGISDVSGNIRLLSVIGANIMPILISFIVYNYMMYYDSFPIVISFSVTRKDFFKSLIVDNIFVAFVYATIQGILMIIDPVFVKAIGKIPLYDFVFFNTDTDNILFIVFSLFMMFLTYISIWNLIAALNYKFGAKIWIPFVGIAYIKSITKVGKTSEFIMHFIKDILNSRIDLYQFLKLGIIIAICYALAYIITIKTNIKHKVG